MMIPAILSPDLSFRLLFASMFESKKVGIVDKLLCGKGVTLGWRSEPDFRYY
jgi:hypothetical protein